ncbi:hypothetical protein GCM10027074_54570 [Streptomyces deserti]
MKASVPWTVSARIAEEDADIAGAAARGVHVVLAGAVCRAARKIMTSSPLPPPDRHRADEQLGQQVVRQAVLGLVETAPDYRDEAVRTVAVADDAGCGAIGPLSWVRVSPGTGRAAPSRVLTEVFAVVVGTGRIPPALPVT